MNVTGQYSGVHSVERYSKRCKPLLEHILGVKIRKIEYPELQKSINIQYQSKSIRLDVYVEDDENTVYNIEMQTTRHKNLPKRMRYYQGMIDLNIIDKGEDYASLKKSYVIFICTFDQYGKGRYIYTFNNYCKEDKDIEFEDEATKIVVNAKGSIGDISFELKDTLDFIAGKEPQSEYAKDLQKAVEEVKHSEEWRREYMTLLMRDKEQQKIGDYKRMVASIRNNKNDKDNPVSDKQIIKLFGLGVSDYNRIVYFIDSKPEWKDEEIAEAVINGQNE